MKIHSENDKKNIFKFYNKKIRKNVLNSINNIKTYLIIKLLEINLNFIKKYLKKFECKKEKK